MLSFGALLCAISLLTAISTFAQQSAGCIDGIVKDPHNAYVPGASVTMINTNTNVKIAVKTNKSGVYRIAGLLPGFYELVVEAKGFATKVIIEVRIGIGKVGKDVKLEYPRIDL
jgi:hypothetical protein